MTLSIDSATADEAKDFIFAWQRTRPTGSRPEDNPPSVTMMGIGWGITLPPCDRERAEAVMLDFAVERTKAADRAEAKTQTQGATHLSLLGTGP